MVGRVVGSGTWEIPEKIFLENLGFMRVPRRFIVEKIEVFKEEDKDVLFVCFWNSQEKKKTRFIHIYI